MYTVFLCDTSCQCYAHRCQITRMLYNNRPCAVTVMPCDATGTCRDMQASAIGQKESKTGLEEKADLFLKNEFVMPVMTGILRLMLVLQDVNGEVCRKLLLKSMTRGLKSMHARSWEG